MLESCAPSTPKGRPPRDLPRSRVPANERRQPDAPQAPAGRPGDRPGDRGPVDRGGGDEPAAARARAGRRGGEPPREVALGARRARAGPRALPDGARARPDEPDRRAEHRPPPGPARRCRRADRPGAGGQQGAGLDLRRGDRQDRLRLPDRSAEPPQARPGQPGRRGRAGAGGQPPDRHEQRHADRRRRAARRRTPPEADRRRATSTRPG